MKNIFEPNDYSEIITRINRLSENSQRKWGTMSVEQMCCHLSDAIEIPLGKRKMKSEPTRMILGNPLMTELTIRIPWPKNILSSPKDMNHKFRGSNSITFQKDKERLLSLLEELQNYPQELAPHPMTGKMNKNTWGRFLAKHFNYHLTQFGV